MRKGFNLYGAYRILQYAHSKKVNILHTHGYKPNILLGMFPRGLRKIPVVCTLHGWTNTARFSKLRLYEWLELKIIKHMDGIVLVSRKMKEMKKIKSGSFDESRMFVVENGISCGESKNRQTILEEFESFGGFLGIDDFVIGATGRLSEEKGLNFLIDAVNILHEKGYVIKLIIIGEGPLYSELQSRVSSLGLDDYVLFPGYVRNARKLLKIFDIFIISSLTEGLPVTLLEAMCEKVPLIATSVGGIPDVLTDMKSGILIPPGNAGSIADAVIKLYEDRQLAVKLSEAAHKIMELRYSVKAMAQGYLDVYESMD